MRIAQVAQLGESIPPAFYGGTSRVVSYLTEALVAQGHEVTLFAPGDSVTNARLVAPCATGLWRESSSVILAQYSRMLSQVLDERENFDVIHFHSNFLRHVDFMHFPLFDRQPTPQITTIHWRLDIPELLPLYEEHREMPVVAISAAQQRPASWLNWRGVVYHGLPTQLYTFVEREGTYLAFLGRLCPHKGPDRAIEIARRAGMRIKVGGNVSPDDQDYFDRILKPLFQDPLVEFVGEVRQDEKRDFLGGAYAVLFPVDWPEPFGVVMIETMACGTPIIGYRHGSVPELIQDGANGFVVDDLAEAVSAVGRIPTLSRSRCRMIFEERFTASRMARDYVTVYAGLLNSWDLARPQSPSPQPTVLGAGRRTLGALEPERSAA